jgi:hypothetical protein
VLVCIEKKDATEYPRFHTKEAAGPIKLGYLVNMMKAKVEQD